MRRKVIFFPPTELSEAIRASLCFLSLDQLMYHPIVSPLLSSTNWDCILTCYSCMTHLATKNNICSLSVSLPCFWLSLMKPGFIFTTSRPLTTNIHISIKLLSELWSAYGGSSLVDHWSPEAVFGAPRLISDEVVAQSV